MKRVISVWLPAWPMVRLARAQRAAVPLDQPFALVVSGAHGLTISAVNAAAAREGVRVGTALADARAALPSLISRPAELEADRIALLRLARWAGRYGPNRHVDGDDGLWIDITGVAHLFGGEENLLDDLTRRLASFAVPSFGVPSFGVPVQAGLADTLGAAHALARFGCPEGAAWAIAPETLTREALAPLTIEALRLDAPRVLLLKRLGLRRIGQLYDIPRDSLARRFRSKEAASAVLTRLDQALGLLSEPRRPMQTPPVLSVMRAFSDPLISSEPLETAASELCAELAAALSAKGLGAKAVRLALYRADGTCAQADAAMSMPSRDGPHIMGLLKDKLAAVDAGFGIDLLRLDAVRVERQQVHQETLAANANGARADVGPLIDKLSNRFGLATVSVLRPQASHIPERAEARAPALFPSPLHREAMLRIDGGGVRGGGNPNCQQLGFPPSRPPPQGGRRSVEHLFPREGGDVSYEPPWPYRVGPYKGGPYGRAAQRPPFVLKRPEPIEVIAEVPDGPPARFTWRRVERRVARAQGPERIAPEWWRHIALAEDQKRPRPRDYYKIEDHDGAAYWVFRHGLYGGDDDCGDNDSDPPRWFLHGLFS